MIEPIVVVYAVLVFEIMFKVGQDRKGKKNLTFKHMTADEALSIIELRLHRYHPGAEIVSQRCIKAEIAKK